MSAGEFTRVGPTEECLYGPRGLLICGAPDRAHDKIREKLREILPDDLPILFIRDDQADLALKEALCLPDGSGHGEESTLRLAVIMSGFTGNQLKELMAAWRQNNWPRPLWATLTPVSENWPIRALLEELAAEDEAMRRQQE